MINFDPQIGYLVNLSTPNAKSTLRLKLDDASDKGNAKCMSFINANERALWILLTTYLKIIELPYLHLSLVVGAQWRHRNGAILDLVNILMDL